MTPYEIMLSESQERMLLVAEKGREDEVFRVFQKWGLDAVTIGRVIRRAMRVLQHGEIVAEIPNPALTDEAPIYNRPMQRWEPPVEREKPEQIHLGETGDLTAVLKRLLAASNICSTRWVYEQYDSMVQTNTVEGPGDGDGGVIRIKGTDRGLAMALDGNGRWCWLDPTLGAMHAVAESARNVACTGAVPAAATNCLNFGNPEKPPVMWQFSQTIDGITSACEELECPITGGNVSFYNETLSEAIYPTPVIGIVGIIEDVNKADAAALPRVGPGGGAVARLRAGRCRRCRSRIWLLRICQGNPRPDLGIPAGVGIGKRSRVAKVHREIDYPGLVNSAHDCSEGGLAVALAKCGFRNGVGAQIKLSGRGAAGGIPALWRGCQPDSGLLYAGKCQEA